MPMNEALNSLKSNKLFLQETQNFYRITQALLVNFFYQLISF